MLITLIIILLLIGAAVISSIYSNFVVFYSNFFESENYHKAYYASISALERGELVTKQRAPGFIGSGGFILGEGTGSSKIPDGASDNNLSGFSYLGDDADESSVFRTVNSRTNRIPSEGNGDVEWMISADDSPNYNMMGFENSEVFLLYYDNRDDEHIDDSSNNPSPYRPYTTDYIRQSHPKQITGEIRLPKQLQLSGGYGLLDTSNSLVGKAGELPNDDAIVDWQIRGNYREKPFVVYSTQSTTRSRINSEHDSIFREDDINGPLLFNFEVKGSPIIKSLNPMHQNNDVPRTVISEYESEIKNNTFNDFFNNNNFQNNSLRFSLLNLLKTTNSGQYYPFLEYYADFGTDVSDKYYTIDGEGNYKDFQVNTIIQKPTVKETVLGNFTSIF